MLTAATIGLMADNLLSFALDPCRIMDAMGKPADPWQRQVLMTNRSFILNCTRQSGKSTVAGTLAAHKAVFKPESLTVIVSKSQRQAGETFRKALNAYYAMGAPVEMRNLSTLYLELENDSRIISLPGKEGTIRGYSAVDLLLIDEASRVPEDIYKAVRPMLAISKGQLGIMSTPLGARGFFWKEWVDDQNDFLKIKVSADDCPRFDEPFLKAELRSLGESMFRQEYYNSFVSVEGLVFPNFHKCFVTDWPYPKGRTIGGIDWGWRNPFAAVWGIHDPDTDILWLQGERYHRETALSNHRDALRALNASWAADPAGATEIQEFRAGSITVYKGNNDQKAGIAAITARIETGRLKIWKQGTPNLIEEAGLYRYPDKQEFHPDPEKPIDEYNHALSALRYLVSLLDRRFMAHYRKTGKAPELIAPASDFKPSKPRTSPAWLKRLRDPSYQWKVLQ